MKRILLFVLVGALAFGAVTSCKKDVFYTVTFNSEGGSPVASQRVQEGDKAVKPADPTRDGYKFIEWTRSATGDAAWNFSTDVVRSDMTLFAQWDSSDRDATLAYLNELIAEANTLSQGDYSSASWTPFLAALNAAKEVVGNSGASSADIAKAVGDLEDTMGNLVPNADSGDRNGLSDAIDGANSLDSGDYTSDSWGDLQDAVYNAQDVLDDPASTREQIQDAIDGLNDAIDGLVNDPNSNLDKSGLNAAISAAGGKNEADWTPDSWDLFENALATAKSVSTNPNATASQINSARNNLETADRHLTPIADKTALNATIAKAEALDGSEYTSSSWSALQSALSAAEDVSDDPNASAGQVTGANNALQNAIGALVKSTPKTKSDLSALIAQAQSYNQSSYTAGSASALQSAINYAQEVEGDSGATSTDITNAYNSLVSAIGGLVPLSSGGGGGGGGILSVLSIGNSYGSLGSTVTPTSSGLDSENLRAMLMNTQYFGPSGTVRVSQLVLTMSAQATYQSSDPTALEGELAAANVVMMPGYGLDNTQMGGSLGDVSTQCATAIADWLKSSPKHVLIMTFDTSNDNGNTLAALVNSGYISYNMAWSNDWTPIPAAAGVPGGDYYYGSAPDSGGGSFMTGPFGTVERGVVFHAKDGASQFIPAGAIPSSVTPIMNVAVNSAAAAAETANMLVGVDMSKRIVWMGESQYGSNDPVTAGMQGSSPTGSAVNMIMANLWGWIANTAAN